MLKFKNYCEIISETANAGLAAKAAKSGISIGTLRKVYNRGMAAWNSGHRPGTTPQQWAMARVNSYISHGSGTYGGADKDLHEEVDAVKALEDSLSKPTGYDAIDQMMDGIAKQCKITPKELHNSFVKKHGKSPDEYAKSMAESTIPKQYVAGLSDSTAKSREAHFKKMDKLSDSDPRAYELAPGDATAKTKESKFTKKYHAMYGENVDEEILQAVWDGDVQVDITGLDENGLWANIHAKRQRIKNGSGERMRKPGSKGAPSISALQSAKEEADHDFDLIEEVIEELALLHNLDSDQIWETLEKVSDEELLEYAIDKKGYKSSTGGLTQKGVDAYNAKTGGNLKTAVTTKPSKLKPGSKAANRRKSFCARMGGMKKHLTSAKTANDPDSRINKALRKWNC